MKITEASKKLKIKIKFADERKRSESKGKGCIHHLHTVLADGTVDKVYLQLPRALTFGIRPNMNNSGPVPKYQLTLKFAFEQKEAIVDPFREIHDLIKDNITENFHIVLPNTTKFLLNKMNKKNKKIPVDLFEQDWKSDALTMARDTFFEVAREKVDEVCIFGGSEEDFEMHKGKAKLVTFAPMKTGKDGKTYDKAWNVNIACPIMMKRGGGVEYCPMDACDEGIKKPHPMFSFSACESPENNLKKKTDIEPAQFFDKLAPIGDGTPFSREGISVVSLPYIHVRDDESAISTNISMEHFHALIREQSSVLGKRTFTVVEDDDTPQQVNDEEEEYADQDEEEEEEEDEAQEEEEDV